MEFAALKSNSNIKSSQDGHLNIPINKYDTSSGRPESSDHEGKRTFFGITIKREFTVWQFVTIPLCSACTIMVGVYMNA